MGSCKFTVNHWVQLGKTATNAKLPVAYNMMDTVPKPDTMKYAMVLDTIPKPDTMKYAMVLDTIPKHDSSKYISMVMDTIPKHDSSKLVDYVAMR